MISAKIAVLPQYTPIRTEPRQAETKVLICVHIIEKKQYCSDNPHLTVVSF